MREMLQGQQVTQEGTVGREWSWAAERNRVISGESGGPELAAQPVQ